MAELQGLIGGTPARTTAGVREQIRFCLRTARRDGAGATRRPRGRSPIARHPRAAGRGGAGVSTYPLLFVKELAEKAGPRGGNRSRVP